MPACGQWRVLPAPQCLQLRQDCASAALCSCCALPPGCSLAGGRHQRAVCQRGNACFSRLQPWPCCLAAVGAFWLAAATGGCWEGAALGSTLHPRYGSASLLGQQQVLRLRQGAIQQWSSLNLVAPTGVAPGGSCAPPPAAAGCRPCDLPHGGNSCGLLPQPARHICQWG